MKRIIIMVILGSVILITGCSNDSDLPKSTWFPNDFMDEIDTIDKQLKKSKKHGVVSAKDQKKIEQTLETILSDIEIARGLFPEKMWGYEAFMKNMNKKEQVVQEVQGLAEVEDLEKLKDNLYTKLNLF